MLDAHQCAKRQRFVRGGHGVWIEACARGNALRIAIVRSRPNAFASRGMPGAMAFVVGAIGTSGMLGYVGLTLAAATGCGGGDCKVEDKQPGWCKHEQFHLFAFHPLALQSVTPP